MPTGIINDIDLVVYDKDIKDGDIITIDVKNKKIDVALSDEEIRERLKNWKRPAEEKIKGILGIYAKLAASAAEGGMIKI